MTATPRNYFNDTQSIISDHPTTKDATVGQTPAHPVDPKPVPAASQRAKSVPKVTAVKKNKFQFFAPIKRKFQAIKEWVSFFRVYIQMIASYFRQVTASFDCASTMMILFAMFLNCT